MQMIISLSEVSQEFDLNDLLKADISDAPEIALNFAQEVIDYIVDRASNGKGLGGESLAKPYSDEYADSLVFKAFGKSKGNVNMRLKGQMLSDLDVLSVEGPRVKIGFRDDTEIKKAFNHQTGDTVPVRRFFGLTRKEALNIASRYKSEVDISSQLKPDESTPQGVLNFAEVFNRSRKEKLELPKFKFQTRRTMNDIFSALERLDGTGQS